MEMELALASQTETEVEIEVETKVETEVETQVETQVETKVETKMETKVELCVSNSFVAPGYFKQDLCTLIQNNKLLKALLYFPPKYTPDKKGRQDLYDDL
jgi:hypothetical protein